MKRLMPSKRKVLIFMAACICGTQLPAAQASEPSWLQGATVKGFVSAYDWTSINHYFSGYDQYTFAVGGGIFLETPKYDGFSLAIEPLVQSGLGMFPTNSNLRSPSLGNNITSLGQAYIGYNNYGINAKVGNVELNHTPWNGSNIGYRILPIVYQGASVNYAATKNLKFYAARITRWQYYTQSQYDKRTAYSIYLPEAGKDSSGFLSLGTKYKGKVLGSNYLKTNSELWYYNYYQYDRLYLAQSVNTIGNGAYKVILGAQFMHAGKNNGFLGNVNSQLYGGELGVKNSSSKVELVYDYIPSHPGSFNYGGLVTPYNTITSSGPIFAQPVVSSTQDFGAGTAMGLKFDYYGVKHLFAQLRYTYLHMRTAPAYNKYSEYDLILSYNFPEVKGLNLTDIGAIINEEPNAKPNFYENRLMLVYDF